MTNKHIIAKHDCCDLPDSIFNNTNVEQTDYRTAYNYHIDIETNFIKNAKFSLDGLKGLLDKYKIMIE